MVAKDLEKLHVPDFNNASIGELRRFYELIQNMESELDEETSIALICGATYNAAFTAPFIQIIENILNKILGGNEKNTDIMAKMYDIILNYIMEQLKRDDLSPEERAKYEKWLKDIKDAGDNQDRRNKIFYVIILSFSLIIIKQLVIALIKSKAGA